MSYGTKTLPVLKWYIRFERIHDEAVALLAWRNMVIAQGWSPVGDAEIASDEAGEFAIGKVVKHSGLNVSPDAWDVVVYA